MDFEKNQKKDNIYESHAIEANQNLNPLQIPTFQILIQKKQNPEKPTKNPNKPNT
jgi:hypothetical protein